MGELGSDNARVSVWPCDFSPDHSDLAALAFFRCSVDICDALAKVEPVRKHDGQYCIFFSVVGLWSGVVAVSGIDEKPVSIGLHLVFRSLQFVFSPLLIMFLVAQKTCGRGIGECITYLEALVSSTPSILSSDVLGLVFRFPRWYDKCLPLTYSR